MSPRNYPRRRTTAEQDRALREWAEEDQARQRARNGLPPPAGAGAPSARVRADGGAHSPGFRRTRVIADLRRELALLAAEDKSDSARSKQRQRVDELGVKRSNADWAWLAERAASDDFKHRNSWLVLAECFRQTRTPSQAASMLLGLPIPERTRVRAIEAFGALIDD